MTVWLRPPQYGYVPSTSVTGRRACVAFEERIITGAPMSRVINYIPRVAIFLAGVATAALTMPRRERVSSEDAASFKELKRAIADLEARMQANEAGGAAK